MNDKHILDSPEAVKVIKKFNLKRLVSGRGHDCGGLIADLCIGSRVMAEYHDDGWGGEPEIVFRTKDGQELVQNILKDGNFEQLLLVDGGWNELKLKDGIPMNTQIECLVVALGELKDREKEAKLMQKAFVFGTNWSRNQVSWPRIKNLSEVPLYVLQKTYNKYKAELKPNEKFFNSDEQLKALGIKL